MSPHAAPRAEEYVRAIERERKEKDHFFARSPHSPIPPRLRRGFHGLRYFPPDPAYRVPARLAVDPTPPTLTVQTSTGEVREYVVLGKLEFALDGAPLALSALWQEGAQSLFVPFRDATSAKETYGAGRYLDIEWIGPDAEYVVDFNLAYNPYCAYAEDYSCPFPPPSNWLSVRIEAGERSFET